MSLLPYKYEKHLPVALGVAAVIIIGGGISATGLVSGWQAHTHLNSILPSVRFLSSSMIAGTATILSLLLALISFSQTMREERDLKAEFFYRIKLVGRSAATTLIAAILVLALISIPIEQSDKISQQHYTVIYYVILAAVALLSGAMVFTIALLYRCISNLIDLVHPEVDPEENPLVEAVGEEPDDGHSD